MKLVITGAGGFLGTCATRFFMNQQGVTQLNALYSKPTEVPNTPSKLSIYVGDLRNESASLKLVEDADVVLHFAHRGNPKEGHVATVKTVTENLKMTGLLLDSMKKKNAKRLIYVSRADGLYKYDPFKRVPHHELSELEYRSTYSLSKITVENMLHYYEQSQGIRAVILRASNIYSKEEMVRPNHSFIGHVLSQVKKGEPVSVPGGFDTYKDYLFIDDFLRALNLFIQKKELSGTFNIGSGVGTTPREILTNAERITGTKIKTQITDRNPAENAWTILNTQKIQRALMWSCHFTLFNAMRAVWNESLPATDDSKKAA